MKEKDSTIFKRYFIAKASAWDAYISSIEISNVTAGMLCYC